MPHTIEGIYFCDLTPRNSSPRLTGSGLVIVDIDKPPYNDAVAFLTGIALKSVPGAMCNPHRTIWETLTRSFSTWGAKGVEIWQKMTLYVDTESMRQILRMTIISDFEALHERKRNMSLCENR